MHMYSKIYVRTLHLSKGSFHTLWIFYFFSFSERVNKKLEKMPSQIYHSSWGKANSWNVNMIVDSLEREYIFRLTCHSKVRKLLVIVNAIVLQEHTGPKTAGNIIINKISKESLRGKGNNYSWSQRENKAIHTALGNHCQKINSPKIKLSLL